MQQHFHWVLQTAMDVIFCEGSGPAHGAKNLLDVKGGVNVCVWPT